jgi:hypothetical protein
MKLSELIERLDSESEPYYGSALQESIFNTYGYANLSEHGFTSKKISYWCCTDTTVGSEMIYRDNQPICLSFQQYRKSDPEFYWISEEVYKTTKSFIESLEEEEEEDAVEILNLDQEVKCTYQIGFISQLYSCHTHAFYEGKLYEIHWKDEDFSSRRRDYSTLDEYVPLIGESSTFSVNIKDLHFPIPLKP